MSGNLDGNRIYGDHNHLLIWLCLIGIMCGWSCVDCTGRERRIDFLERRIDRLEHLDASVN